MRKQTQYFFLKGGMMLLSEERGNVVRWEPERPIKQVEVGQNWTELAL
jgi:hypothetical protein